MEAIVTTDEQAAIAKANEQAKQFIEQINQSNRKVRRAFRARIRRLRRKTVRAMVRASKRKQEASKAQP
jgi:hypothetical protein